jgi:hypothetical protein
MEINIWGTELDPPDLRQPEPLLTAEQESDCPEAEPIRKTLLGLIIPLFLKPDTKVASDCD